MFRNTYLNTVISCLAVLAAASTVSHAQTQTDMNQSANADYKKADAELNKSYQDVFNKLDASGKTDLKAAQNAWIKYRDLDCKFQSGGASGGSVQAMVVAGCLTDKTVVRTKELNELLHCQEGDVSCVVAP